MTADLNAQLEIGSPPPVNYTVVEYDEGLQAPENWGGRRPGNITGEVEEVLQNRDLLD